MIYQLQGTIIEKKPDFLALDVHGITFAVFIPLTTYHELPPVHSSCLIHTWLIHKEDKMELYGFHSKDTRDFFKLLIGLSGVGPKLALILLSNLSPADLSSIVENQNKERLKRINGVGPKKAEKIIFELKGKLKNLSFSGTENTTSGIDEDAFLALSSLGYSDKEAQAVLNNPEVRNLPTLEEKLKAALQIFNKG